ncbi:MAG: Transcription termination/antitermination protein NusG [Planctomycetes bacterium]|nr:transcription termination/antitermination factor NusG [Planctomycetota bacterium]MCG3185278.1 Transcription termination/antitermination protein NusG [Planctomycetota bacterium]
MKMWYVLRVQSSREEKIKENLEKRVKARGLEGLFDRMVIPTETVQEIKGGKKRERKRKVYPGYLYLEVETEEDNAEGAEHRWKINGDAYHLIRETPGVGDFVGDRNQPVPMSTEDVSKILRISEPKEEGEEKVVKIEFAKGDAVKIKDGPFDGFEGNVEEVDPEKGRIQVIVTIFGRATPVELEYWQVEKV